MEIVLLQCITCSVLSNNITLTNHIHAIGTGTVQVQCYQLSSRQLCYSVFREMRKNTYVSTRMIRGKNESSTLSWGNNHIYPNSS